MVAFMISGPSHEMLPPQTDSNVSEALSAKTAKPISDVCAEGGIDEEVVLERNTAKLSTGE